MRRRNFLTMGGAAGVAVAIPRIATAPATALAATTRTARPATGSRDSGPPGALRALAEKIGLRIGTAVIPFDLDTPGYTAILAEQFSAVTPGNEMKWGVVEPTQAVFDWSGADRLVRQSPFGV
jgi:endo-1,4-beta-xylanase